MQAKSVLIVSYLDKDTSDNYVVPQQIVFCNTKVIHHILTKISEEIKQKLRETELLTEAMISEISDKREIIFFEGSTISSLKVTSQNTVFDKTYYVDKNMINVTILQEN